MVVRSIVGLLFLIILSIGEPSAAMGRSAGDEVAVERWSVLVPAPVDDVWTAWTDPQTLRVWAGDGASLDNDPRQWRLPLGGESSLVLRESFREPGRLLLLVPADQPDPPTQWYSVRLVPVTLESTRLVVAHCTRTPAGGDPPDETSPEDLSSPPWPALLERCRAHFVTEPPSEELAAIACELERLIGGDWIHEEDVHDGALIRSRTRWERGPDGRSLIGRSWFGGNELHLQGHMQIWREPEHDGPREYRFQTIDSTGAVARGRLQRDEDGALHWDWMAETPIGALRHYDVRIQFVDADRYAFRVREEFNPGEWVDRMNVEFHRVEELPPAFQNVVEPEPAIDEYSDESAVDGGCPR